MITAKIKKAFTELVALGLVEDKPVRFFGAQATGCSPISTAVKNNTETIEPQRPNTIMDPLAGDPVTRADGADAPRAICVRRAGGPRDTCRTWRLFQRSRNWRGPRGVSAGDCRRRDHGRDGAALCTRMAGSSPTS